MQTENEDYLYPATSECWVCGSVQLAPDRTVALRRCMGTPGQPHEAVMWNERLPNTAPVASAIPPNTVTMPHP